MDFRQKYLKYKKKYLDLKVQQMGGDNEEKFKFTDKQKDEAYKLILDRITWYNEYNKSNLSYNRKIEIIESQYNINTECYKNSSSNKVKCPKIKLTYMLDKDIFARWETIGKDFINSRQYPITIKIGGTISENGNDACIFLENKRHREIKIIEFKREKDINLNYKYVKGKTFIEPPWLMHDNQWHKLGCKDIQEKNYPIEIIIQ